MDQNKIIEALQEALTKGTGSLDDLDKLLVRAREDVVAAKKAEAEAAKKAEAKRGEDVAQIATRILNREMTNADMAFILNTYFGQHKLMQTWTPEGIDQLMSDCSDKSDEAKQVEKKAQEVADSIIQMLHDVLGLDIDPKDIEVREVKKPATKKPDINKKDPDDVINDFLKKFGLA